MLAVSFKAKARFWLETDHVPFAPCVTVAAVTFTSARNVPEASENWIACPGVRVPLAGVTVTFAGSYTVAV